VSNEDDKIVILHHEGLPDKSPFQVVSLGKSFYCKHESLLIDEKNRSVICANPNCAQVLDPFGYLLNNALHISMAWNHHDRMMKEVRNAQERLSELKRQEKNLKALIARLQKKTDGLVTNTRIRD